MKLATYQDGSRDGQLVVVSRDLSQAHYATHIANHLQHVLDDWNFLAPQLEDVYTKLNHGRAPHAFAFDPARCMAPLPRAYQWAYADSAYPYHRALLDSAAHRLANPASGVQPSVVPAQPAVLRMVQGAGDSFTGPQADLVCAQPAAQGLDFEASLAVITDDVPAGCHSARALDGVRLLMLVNNVTLRHGVPPELSKPGAACAPVAVTPDELGEAWARGRVHLALQSSCNGRKVGMSEAGQDMGFHFGQLIAHLASTRALQAGCVVGTGAVSNPGVDRKGRTDWPQGYSCLVEKRAMETLQDGQPSSGYLQWGDTVRIEVKGRDGRSVFGAIAQTVVAPKSVDAGAAAPAPAPAPASTPAPAEG